VIFLSHWASRLGGAEYSLLEILSCAAKRWECHLVSAEDGLLHERARAMGVICHVVRCDESIGRIRRYDLAVSLLKSWRGWFHFFAYVIRLRRTIVGLKPHVVHANVPKSHAALFLLCKLGLKAECCFHIREIFGPSRFASFAYRMLLPRRCSRIIAISTAVLNSLPPRLRKQAVVIYNGVRLDVAQAPAPRTSDLRLLYLGRVVPWKGCHTLVDILHKTRAICPRAAITLDIVGDTAYWTEEYREELARKIRSLALESVCTLLPHSDDITGVFCSHQVFCSASYLEPFGRALAEAHGHGLPVVAYDSGGVNEIVVHNETGFLVPYGREDLFADAIGRFVAQPRLVASMGTRGRDRVVARFDSATQTRIVCEFLEKRSGLQSESQEK